jgi:hypothetical protein
MPLQVKNGNLPEPALEWRPGPSKPLARPMKLACLLILSCALFLAPPAFAADLSAYSGLYPFDEIGGYAFFDNPVVKRAIDGAAGEGISDWIAELQVGAPIEKQDDGLIAIVCEAHNCTGNNAAVAVSISGVLIAACIFSENAEHGAPVGTIRWVALNFDKHVENVNDEGCPHDASDFLDAYARVIK